MQSPTRRTVRDAWGSVAEGFSRGGPRSTAGDGSPAGSAGSGLPFDRRVMILVEIADDPNETALAAELFAHRGWPVRPAEEPERAGCPPERVARVVEVRLTGAREGAVERALGLVDGLAVAASLNMWARDAVLLEHEPERYTAWRVRPAPGVPRPGRVVRAVEPRGRTGAQADLRTRALAGQVYAADVDVDPADVASTDVRANLLLVNLGNLLAFSAAALAIVPHTGWQPFGWSVTVLFGLPWLVAGLRHALRDSPARRAALWALPLASPVLLPFVTWLGGLVQDRYVGSFGIPSDSVHAGATDRLWAGAWPVTGVLYCVAFGVAAHGWNRRFHARPDARDLGNAAFAAAAGLFLGLALVVVPFSVHVDTSAAADAENAAVHLQEPPSYYGLRPVLVCVRPVAPVAHPERGFPGASYGGTVPLTRPVLTFGPDGDRIWLWDPQTRRAFSMALADAAFEPFDPGFASGGGRACS
ncbi:hypothetical protein [Actinacidiphila acidipaludis]|uniref:Uncharacterized protein n=1 Tax=Actinacidiphila acidipaludis TaxID=2873382 RepID=A0ABS7QEC1_9ACTN|nr:hypothetical protein [Streptomyces acidipaludis]MBY8881044.1 hypothetical protein [Streptomyces acidipaludis]